MKETHKGTILFVSHEMSYTGAPSSLLRMCRVAQSLGYEIVVWSMQHGDFEQEFEFYNIHVDIIRPEQIGSEQNTRVVKSCCFAVCNTIVTVRYVKAFHNTLPVIWFIREGGDVPAFVKRNPIMKEMMLACDYLCCPSEYAARYIKSIVNREVVVLHNCIEDEVSAGTIHEPGNDDKVKFIAMGTICYRKGYDVLVKAYKTLPPAYRKCAELYIAGVLTESNKDYAFDILCDIQMEKDIHYLGVISGKNKKEYFSRMDVVVVPSRDESCSLVALEGAMYGKPLIVTVNVGAKYLVGGDNGTVVRTNDSAALRKGMMRMIEEKQNLSAMGRESRRLYEALASMEAHRKNLAVLYSNVGRNVKDKQKKYVDKENFLLPCACLANRIARIPKGAKVILWGDCRVGRIVYSRLFTNRHVDIVGVVNPEYIQENGNTQGTDCKMLPIEVLNIIDYDFIVSCVDSDKEFTEVARALVQSYGIDGNKIIA